MVESLWTKLAGRNRGTVILKSLVKMAGTKLFMSKLEMLDLKFWGIFLDKVRVKKTVANVALNCKAILYIELAGVMNMEVRIPSVNKARFPAVWFYRV